MAYIVITAANGEELARRMLSGLTIIGRSPDCEIRLHDHLMSREHCGIEEVEDDRFVVVDLDSRNGTLVNDQRIVRHELLHGDVITIGRTTIAYHEGVFIENRPERRGPISLTERPVDPFEALSATVVDYAAQERFEAPCDRNILRPTPRPRPVSNRAAQLPVIREVEGNVGVEEAAVEANEEVGSSPTWATRRSESAAAALKERIRRLEEMGPLPEMQPVAEEKPKEIKFGRRVTWLMAEMLVVSGVLGAGIVALLRVL